MIAMQAYPVLAEIFMTASVAKPGREQPHRVLSEIPQARRGSPPAFVARDPHDNRQDEHRSEQHHEGYERRDLSHPSALLVLPHVVSSAIQQVLNRSRRGG